MWVFVWIIIIFVGIGITVSLPKWLIDVAVQRKGKWLTVAETLNVLCLILAVPVTAYILIIGVIRLFDESWPIALATIATGAFVVYFYIAKDEDRRKTELTPKLADEIINQYGAALEAGLSGDCTAIRKSTLPCPKEKVKQAFKLALAFQIDYRSLKDENRSLLISGLMHLGSFVPDDQADLVNSGTRKLGDPAFNEFVDYQTSTSLAIYEEMNAFVAEVMGFEEFDPLFHQKVCTLIGLEYSRSFKQAFTEYANEIRP